MEFYYTFNDEYADWIATAIFKKMFAGDKGIIGLIGEKSFTQYDLDGFLIIASLKGSNELILKLLVLGANKDAKSKTDVTPLILLARRDNVEMVKHFIKIGANVFSHDKQCSNMFNWAGKDVMNYLENNFIITEKSESPSAFLEPTKAFLEATKALLEKNAELEKQSKDVLEKNAELEKQNKDLLEKNTNLESEKDAIQMELNKETMEKKKAQVNQVEVKNALQSIRASVYYAHLRVTKEIDDIKFDKLLTQ